MERMAEWSIGARITFIAAMMAAGLCLSGGMGLFSSWRISDLFAEYRFGSEQVVAANDIAEDLFEAKQAEMLYRRQPSPPGGRGRKQPAGSAGRRGSDRDDVR